MTKWRALGYIEIDWVSLVRYLGSLGCRTDWALWYAAFYQQSLTLELAGVLMERMERAVRLLACGERPGEFGLGRGLGQVTKMTPVGRIRPRRIHPGG